MAICSNRLEESAGDVLTGALREADDLIVVNPPRVAMNDVIAGVEETRDPPQVRLFAAPDSLAEVLDDFVTAATVADLVAEGTLAIRTLESVPHNALLVSPESVAALVSVSGQVAGLAETDDEFVTSTYETFDEQWRSAPEYTLRTPPLSEIRSTLRTEIGEETAADFDRLLDVAESGVDLDEVVVSLLAAARNGTLLYDVSQWGEEVDLASKATFSRTKTKLEEAGVVETEKVPIDVGRPRLRLTLPEEFAEAPLEEVARVAESRL